MFCPKCGKEASGKFCPNCGATLDGAQPNVEKPTVSGGSLPMNYHTILSTLGCFLLGAVMVLFGILYLTGVMGSVEGVPASWVYRLYPGFKVIDIIVGILLCLLGIVAVISRGRLAAMQWKGVSAVTGCMVALFLLMLLDPFICSISVKYAKFFELASVFEFILIILFGVIAVASVLYYKKRKHLFSAN